MRQTFNVTGGPQIGRTHLPSLRAAMRAQELDGFFIPHEDAYQNEYLPEGSDRLAWATGFTGSAGAALVFAKSAILFVDGRYTLQARHQVDQRLFDQADLSDPGPFKWLASQSLAGQTIGFDPRLVTPDAHEKLRKAAAEAGATLRAVDRNPVDESWSDQAPEPSFPVVSHDLAFAGESSADKRARVAKLLKKDGADAVIVTSPASIAWLFNIRGSDVKCSPLPLGRAILHADGSAELFLKPEKITNGLPAHLGPDVEIRPMGELERRLRKLSDRTVSLDPGLASVWFFETLEKAKARVIRREDPIALPRARKNDVELEGARLAHRRDGAAMARFLRWLDSDLGQGGRITEIQAAEQLEHYRELGQGLRDLSFETIAGAGPNGAVVHYRVNTQTNRPLARGSLFLVDSGAQYVDGTTDITRTVAIGEPTQEMREAYTLVLRGHIALATARFPVGTTGSALDALARLPLWERGLDFDHGTGHGVGSYLGVHEGPHRISKAPNRVALEPGMIVSNEPGYYKAGEFGIRIENLQYVTPPAPIFGGERDMLGFETLTLAPLDRRLIEPGMLMPAEWRWIDRYHARVLEEISPRLDASETEWLAKACAPL